MKSPCARLGDARNKVVFRFSPTLFLTAHLFLFELLAYYW